MPNLLGTAPNQIPTNGDLGTMAFKDNVNYNEKTSPNVISVNSADTALIVTQTGTGNALLVEDSANPDSSPFVIDASGIAVVGNTTALQITDISGSARTPWLQVHGTGGSQAASSITSWVASDLFPSQLLLGKSKSGTIGTQSVLANGTDIGAVIFSGSDGAALIPAASILAEVDGTPGTNDMPGRLVFSTTADGASSPTERMRIDSAGGVGIGTTATTGFAVRVGRNITGATSSYGINQGGTVQSDVTAAAFGYRNSANVVAASFTLPSYIHFGTTQNSIGAGATVTNQYGFQVDSSLTGATNNYGFQSNLSSGTGRWNFYAAGTADNYFAGSVGIGATANASAILDAQSTTKGVRFPNMTTTQKNAIASPAAGLVVFDTTLAKLCVYTGAAWQTITSA